MKKRKILMRANINRLIAYRPVRFVITGGIATLTHISVAFFLIAFFHTDVFFANVCGFCCAFGLSYSLQSAFVFKKQISWKNAQRFFLVQCCALLVAQLLSLLLVEYSPYLRIIFVVVLLPFMTYLLHRFWTYNDNQP